MRVLQHLPSLAIVCTSMQMAGPPCVCGGARFTKLGSYLQCCEACLSIDPTLSVHRPHTVCLSTPHCLSIDKVGHGGRLERGS